MLNPGDIILLCLLAVGVGLAARNLRKGGGGCSGGCAGCSGCASPREPREETEDPEDQ